MTTRLETLTQRLDAAPGDVVIARLRLHNDAASGATFTIRPVGLDDFDTVRNGGDGAISIFLPAATTTEVDVPVHVPATLGIGEHAAAFDVSTDRSEDRAMLSPFTISIASVERVALVPRPSTIRGRRRAKFALDLVNNEEFPVAFTLDGQAEGVRVRFRDEQFALQPGQQAFTRGKLKGPRHWSGEPTQHNVQIAARGRAATTSITAPYVQRPLFAHKLRMITAAVAIIALWLAAIGGVALWWTNRDDGGDLADGAGEGVEQTVAIDADGDGDIDRYGVDTDGDGVLDRFGVDTDGDGVPDRVAIDTDGDGVPDEFLPEGEGPIPGTGASGAEAGGEEAGGDGSGGDGTGDAGSGSGDEAAGGGTGSGSETSGGPGLGETADGRQSGPAATVVRGTVSADGTDDVSDVRILLGPIDLGAQPAADSNAIGFARSRQAPAKIWSARFGRVESTLGLVRQTQPVAPLEATIDADGVWLFANVPLRQSYELVVAKPGYDTQSFVVTPPEDGSAVELDVELRPASGFIGGRVTGPAGPLGGVEIEVTDGTLAFTTTSSTDGDVGTWSIDAVSTPEVYTVTATLRGYGTEVLQVPLVAGQQATETNISMRRGVGALSGQIVSESGAPLGGVTVTATNGDVTRTTSSLTEGNIGFYSIPQLDIPGVYTVQVELDGYVTQTRRVPLGGSIANVNFVLDTTTLRLTGRVTSSADGSGIVSAGVTLRKGEIEFKVSTAAAPDAGAFSIDDLPPGNYTVTVDHFKHLPSTDFITLLEGADPPPLNITLVAADSGPDIGTGSLVVEVIDPAADNAEDRQIKNATVTLIRTRTGETERTVTQEAFDFRISDIPVGTYTILVSAPRYNDAAPRQVSIGLSEERRQVELLQLGAAAGRIVDAITGEPLSGYGVLLFLQLPNGEELFIKRYTADPGTFSWQSGANDLPIGLYRIEVVDEDAPSGYAVRNDQILDPDLPPPNNVMRFRLLPDLEDTLAIPDIVADPYPNITGRVYEPQLVNGSTQFVPIDDASLKVAMSCGGGAPFDATMSKFGQAGSTDFDTFFIDKLDTDAQKLTGNCELSISADGFEATVVPMADVAISNGVVLSDRIVNQALYQPTDALGGRVFWRDDRAQTDNTLVDRLYLEGVDISTNAITRFSASDTTPTPPGAIPVVVREDLSTSSTAGGSWALPGQVFGSALYSFVEPGFAEGLVEVVIDESLPPTVTAKSGVVLTATGNGEFDVELEPPVDGVVQGTVAILTTDTPQFAAVPITTTDPGDVTVLPTDPNAVTASANDGTFRVDDARSGTWTVDFGLPPNHAYFPDANAAPSTVSHLIGPGTTNIPAFDTTLVELGRVDLTLLEVDGSVGSAETPITSGVTLRFFENGQLVHTATSSTGSGPGGNVFALSEIPVHASDPVNTPVTYDVEIEVPDYDPVSATVTVGGVTTTGSNRSMAFRAGSKIAVTAKLQPFGQITGVVVGRTGPGVFDPNVQVAQGNVEVVAVQVDVNGVPLPGAVPFDATGGPNGTFTVAGPPGYYELSFRHDEFQPLPTTNLPAGLAPIPLPTDNLPAGGAGVTDPPASTVPLVYRLANSRTNALEATGDFGLDLRLSSVQIDVVDGTPPAPISDDFEYTLAYVGGGLTDFTGSVNGATTTFGNVLPGVYELTLRSFDPAAAVPTEDRFPVIANVVVRRSTALVPHTTTVVATMPQLASSIDGTITAESSLGANSQLTAPTPTITADYAIPLPVVNSTTVPNGANTQVTAQLTANGRDQAYSFSNAPFGSHTITPGAAAGFQTPATGTANVTSPNTNPGPTFTYVADDVTVEVVVTPADDDFDGLTATLEIPGGVFSTNGTFDAATRTLTFTGVPPDDRPFTLSISDDVHDPYSDAAVTISPSSTTVTLADVVMTATSGTVEGDVTVVDGPGASSAPLPAWNPNTMTGGRITFTGATTVVENSDGSGEFEVRLAAGTYLMTVTADGYVSESLTVTVRAGKKTKNQDVELEKSATFSLALTLDNTNAPGLDVKLLDTLGTAHPTTESNGTYSAEVPAGAGVGYRFRVKATGLPDTFEPQSSFTPAIGESKSYVLTLYRQLTVNITSANPGTTTVTVDIGGTTTQDTTSPFTFTSDAAGPNVIASTGAGDITIDAANYRVKTFAGAAADQLGTTYDASLPGLVTVSGTATFTGTTTTIPDGTSVTATSGADTLSDSDGTTGGNYSIPGLRNNADGTARTWTISIDAPGVGIGSTTVTVDDSPATTATRDISVTPQNVALTFNVTGAPDTTSVKVLDASSTVVASGTTTTGTVVLQVLETLTNLTYLIEPPGFANETGTLPAFSEADRTETVQSIPALRPLITVTGTVTGATSGTVTATPPTGVGLTNKTATIQNNGTYSLSGLSTGVGSVDADWTLSASQVGVGDGATTVTITSTTASPVPNQDFTLAPVDVPVTFTVTDTATPAMAVNDVSITLGTTSQSTGAGSNTTMFQVSEDSTGAALDWTAEKAGYVTQTGTVSPFPNNRADPAPAITDFAPLATVTGTVSDGTNDLAASIAICPIGSSTTTACGTPLATHQATPANGYSFLPPPVAGSYPVFVTAGNLSGTGTLVLSTNGTSTLGPLTVA